MSIDNEMNPQLDPGESELEMALAGIHPRQTSINRDTLMFEAGRRSARPVMRIWRSIAAALVLVTGLSFTVRPAPRAGERIVYLTHPAVPEASGITIVPPPAEMGPFSMARLQNIAMEKGVEAMPFPPAPASGDLSPARLQSITPSLRPMRQPGILEGDPS